jgi:hypothetical protein
MTNAQSDWRELLDALRLASAEDGWALMWWNYAMTARTDGERAWVAWRVEAIVSAEIDRAVRQMCQPA